MTFLLLSDIISLHNNRWILISNGCYKTWDNGLNWNKLLSQPFSGSKLSFKPDSGLLAKADSAYSFVLKKSASPYAPALLMRARIAEMHDTDPNNRKGLAKPFYEAFIAVQEPKGAALTANEKKELTEAYDYLGVYYANKEKDDVKATDYFNKAKALDPADAQADFYFKQKAGTKSK